MEQIEIAAFSGCSQLSEIKLDHVKFIDSLAFYGCERLTVANLAKAEEVGKFALADCFSLQNVTLCAATTTISEGQFIGCTNLKKIDLPSKLEQIGDSAFAYSSLEEITIPASVKYIGREAFCFHLTDVKTDVICLATVPTSCGKYVFNWSWNYDYSDYFYTPTLHVPAGCKTIYKESSEWYRFTNIVDDAEQMAAPIQVILAEQPSDDATNTYDLYGRKVNQRTKGIVIRNGKKYMK